jgi:ATP-dependent Lhr-like helicase
VSGFLGEQFALPIAIESLRAASKIAPTGEIVTVSAADPLNLVGIVVPGERISPMSLKNISLRDGVVVADESRSTLPAGEAIDNSAIYVARLSSA